MEESRKVIGVGLKVNKDVLEQSGKTLDDIVNIFKTYYLNGEYALGYDTLYVEKPHYHLHFWTDAPMANISKQKSKMMINFGRTTKLSQARDIPNANPDLWFAYAVKENIIHIPLRLDTPDFHALRLSQLEIKKMMYAHKQKKNEIKKEKQTFDDEMFEFITKGLEEKRRKKFQSQELTEAEIASKQYGFKAVATLVINFLRSKDSPRSKSKIEHYTARYLGKYVWKDIDEFHYFFPNY